MLLNKKGLLHLVHWVPHLNFKFMLL